MNLFSDVQKLGSLQGPIHLAIGVFDGVHLGHQAVIRQSLEQQQKDGGTVVVVTCDPHPATVLSTRKAPRVLTSSHHKARLLSKLLQVENLLAVRFDLEFSQKSGESFLRELTDHASIKSISVGVDFQFGKNRSGNVALLETLGEELGFVVNATPIVSIDGTVVSSTQIRESIEAGDFSAAKNLLGRCYTVLGTVVEGRKLGRTLGFPTANLTVHSEILPPTGVYAVRVTAPDGSRDGVANLGYRPTVEGGDVKRLLEVHLLEFDKEIYGEELEVEFVEQLRGEQKFDGIDSLKKQIAMDIEKAKSLF